MASNFAEELARLRNEIRNLKRGQRYAHGGSIEDAALEVRDGTGTVRAVIGMQPDGTVGLIARNGPAPGAPTAPVVTSTIGGLRVVWDGTLADGTDLPADFDHVAVHISTTPGFTPSAATYVGTITKAGEGGMLPVLPLPYVPHYVRLISVNTSGIAGSPSAETAATPLQVEGPDLKAGSVTAAAIQAGAVTAEKLEAILQLVTRLVAGDPNGARVELNEDGLRVYNTSGELVIRFDAEDGSAAFTGTITGSTITGGVIQTATSGPRITLNEGGVNKVLVYDDVVPTAIGELSERGLLLQGTSGAIMWLDPDALYPSLRLTNAAKDNTAIINVVESSSGTANIGVNTGTFAGSGYPDMKWRHYMGEDFAVIERFRHTSSSPVIGGRLDLRAGYAALSYMNTDDNSQQVDVLLTPGIARLRGRTVVQPVQGDDNTLLFLQPGPSHTGPILRYYDPDAGVYRFALDKAGNVNISGVLSAGNIATGTVTITPSAAHTPTSFTVTFPALAGTTFRGFATANTTVPGVRTPVGAQGVTGVGVSGVTATGITIWVNRENTTATNINWMVIGS